MTAPTKGLAQSAIQAAIVTLLKGDATLATLVGARIYDAIPDSTVNDYIAVGDWSEQSDDTLEDGDSGIGADCSVTIEAYTDDAIGGAGYKRAQAIASRVKVLLHGTALAISGWSTVTCEHVQTDIMRDYDQASRPKRHAISTYSVVAEAA